MPWCGLLVTIAQNFDEVGLYWKKNNFQNYAKMNA